MDGFRKVGTVDIGNEAECHCPLAIVLECFVGHHRPKVRAADTDVDDVANPLAAVTFPRTAPYTIREVSHLVENSVDLRHDVLAVNDYGCISRRAEGHV